MKRDVRGGGGKKATAVQLREATPAIEEGQCILCGGKKMGLAATPDFPILAARKIRSMLRMPKRHAIACNNCLPLCAGKRLAFEKRMKNYQLYAALFFFALVAGSFAFRSFDFRILIPAALGSLLILLLPFGSYFPKFAQQKGA